MALYSWSRLLAREKCWPVTSRRSNEDLMAASTSMSRPVDREKEPAAVPPKAAVPVLIKATSESEDTVPPHPELLLFSLSVPMKLFIIPSLPIVVVGLTALIEVLPAWEVAVQIDLPSPSSSTVAEDEPML